MSTFKPLLAPNKQPELSELVYPKLASFKIDGVRGIFTLGRFVSRSFKDIQNKQLREKFKPIIHYTEVNNIIIDGEIYDDTLTFQEIITHTMTQDFEDPKTVKKFGRVLEIPETMKFHIFDTVSEDDYMKPFEERLEMAYKVHKHFQDITKFVEHQVVENPMQVHDLFHTALGEGNEGLMLRSPSGKYKTGRATQKEDIIHKVKPYRTYDAQIISVSQGTVVKEGIEKEKDEFGYSKTSIKKDDRELSDMAKDFTVLYEGKELRVSLSSLTHEERKEIWANKEQYIDKHIEYKGMDVGAKDLPRHPVFIRFREDKDDGEES